MLTESQFRTYQCVKNFIESNGYAPTLKEVTGLLGLKSRSMVHRHLNQIAEAGLIELLPGKRRNIVLSEAAANESCLPLVGRIAAGQPIEAISQEQQINIPQLILGKNRYLLEVKGDSMSGDNICDGDLIICEHSNTARNGQIVVALIDKVEVTLKRFLWDAQERKILLLPSNPYMTPFSYDPDQVEVQGIFIGLLRLGIGYVRS